MVLRAAPAVDLVGIHRLVLIPRTPARSEVIVRIALQAKVRRHLVGLIPTAADCPNAKANWHSQARQTAVSRTEHS